MFIMIAENDNYTLVETNDAIGEDGNYGRAGYAVVNKENGFVEGTTMIRANAMFMLSQFDSMLRSIKEDAAEADAPVLTIVEDPVLPH